MCENLNGSNFADLLRKMVEDWVLADKDPDLVTDNASNMTITVQLLKLVLVKCFVHSINFGFPMCTQATHSCPSNGKNSQHRDSPQLRKSANASHTLNKKHKLLNLPEHKLMTDVAERWNCACDMLEQLFEQQPAICTALLSAEVWKNFK